MTRYIEQYNETTDPVSGDYLWIVDASAPADDRDRKLDFGNLFTPGSWTPTITAASGAAGGHAVQIGRYLRLPAVGWCIAEFIVTLSSKGTLSGNIYVSGFPVAAANIGGFYGATGVLIDNYSGGGNVVLMTIPNDTKMVVIKGANTGYNSQVQASEIGNETTIRGMVLYRTV